MILMKQLLKKMYHDYAVFFPGIDAKEAQKASVILMKAGAPKIPSDYVEFLTMSNGMSWNGLTLFSLNEIDRADGAFRQPGIMQTYKEYLDNPLLNKKLVIGFAPEELIVFYPAQNEYQLVDKCSYNVIVKLPRFFDVLYFYGESLVED